MENVHFSPKTDQQGVPIVCIHYNKNSVIEHWLNRLNATTAARTRFKVHFTNARILPTSIPPSALSTSFLFPEQHSGELDMGYHGNLAPHDTAWVAMETHDTACVAVESYASL